MTRPTQELSPEAIKAVEQVEKLIRLAGKNPNQNEAAAATAKAMELLARYNLDMSVVEQNSGASSGKREDAKFEGGLYQYQRDLWKAVAELNFCLYWNQYTWDETRVSKSRRQRRLRAYDAEHGTKLADRGGYKFQHRVVGRVVNTTMTRTMAEYLLGAIERLTRERYPEPSQFYTRSATSYREGLAEAVIDKLAERRREILRKEQREARAAKKAAEKMQRAEVSTATTLILSSYVKSEEDANIDFVYGEGTSARWAQEEAENAEARRKAREEYTAWAKANPEEAAKKEAERRKARRTSWNAGMGGDRKQRDHSAYYQGMDKGKEISIEPQTDRRRNAGMLK